MQSGKQNVNPKPAFSAMASIDPEETRNTPKSASTQHNHRFPPGSLVWSKMSGYPWWPSMVCNHPIEGKSARKGDIHVMFLDTPVNRSWVSDRMIKHWGESVFKDGTGDKNWENGVNDAEMVAGLSNEKRLETLLVKLLPSDDDEESSDEEVSLWSRNKDKEPERKRRGIIIMDSDDSDGDEDFNPTVEDLKEMEKEACDQPISPAQGRKKHKEKKSSPAAKKNKLASSTPQASVSFPVGKFPSVLTTSKTLSPSSSSSTTTPLPAPNLYQAPSGGVTMMPAQPAGPRPGLTRQPIPGIRPTNKPGLPRNIAVGRGPYRTAGPRPRAPLVIGGHRMPNLRPVTPVKYPSLATPQNNNQYQSPAVTPVKHPSLSKPKYNNQHLTPLRHPSLSTPKYNNQHLTPAATPVSHPSLATPQCNNQHLTPAANPVKYPSLATPQYYNQHLTPVVKLDNSPPHPTSPPSMPAPLEASVAREKVLSARRCLIFPPGISVSKITSSTVEVPTLSLPILAKALIQLGEVDGRKSLVQFQLTQGQVRALDTLGVKEKEL